MVGCWVLCVGSGAGYPWALRRSDKSTRVHQRLKTKAEQMGWLFGCREETETESGGCGCQYFPLMGWCDSSLDRDFAGLTPWPCETRSSACFGGEQNNEALRVCGKNTLYFLICSPIHLLRDAPDTHGARSLTGAVHRLNIPSLCHEEAFCAFFVLFS